MSVALDPYLSLKVLATYSGISIRGLRGFLTDALDPLPHYRVGSKILVRQSEFDAWMSRFRARRGEQVERLVNEIVGEMIK